MLIPVFIRAGLLHESSGRSIFLQSSGKVSNWETSEAEEYYSPQEELDFLSASDQEDNDDYDVQQPVVNGTVGVEHQAVNDIGSCSSSEGNEGFDTLSELPEGKHR